MSEYAPAGAEADKESRYRQVLCPVDGSHGARRAVDHARDLARTHGATVHLLHVIDENTQGETPAWSSDELAFEAFENAAEEFMSEFASELEDADVETVTRCARGRPDREIRSYVAENGIDLVVMGSHGVNPRLRAHTGSTIDRVTRVCSVPVLRV